MGKRLYALGEEGGRSWRLAEIVRFRGELARMKSGGREEEKTIEKWYHWAMYGRELEDSES